MKTLATNEHPSNLDPTARIVREDRAGRWTIYSVRLGFVLTASGRAVEGHFASEAAALDAANALVPNGPSSLAETFAA